MTKATACLKMKTSVDMLVVNYFASIGQLKGRFIQEIDPPWTIWWQPIANPSTTAHHGNMIKEELPQPEKVWEIGQPSGKCKEVSWLDLFRKAVIKKLDSRPIADEVIFITPDKEIFYDVIKQHFILQQGQIEFSVFTPGCEYFLLRIKKPSLWVLNTIKGENWVWYNLVPGQSGIYVEAGYYIHDISSDSCFNKFQITQNGILLIQKNGSLLTLRPKWKKGESIIKVQFAEPAIQQKEEQEILSIKPILRPSDNRLLPTLWKVEDQQRLKAILINESFERFRNFRALISKDDLIWLYAFGKQADRGLAGILSDAFISFVEVCDHVFVPAQFTLAPKLSSERLHEIISGHKSDFIILESFQDTILPYLIDNNDWSPLEEFITLQAEQAAKRAEALSSTWKFEFKDLKKKKAGS